MRLKLDENLGRQHADIFRTAGHDVSTVYQQDLTSASDAEVYDACRSEGRALVTFDLDFANPVRFDPGATAGIVVLRMPRHPTRADLGQVADRLLEALARSDPRGRLWIVERDRIRQYEPGRGT